MSVYSNNTLHKKNDNEAWSKIFDFVKPNARVLDIGCSSGRLGVALKEEKKVYIIGVDVNSEDINLAKQNLDEAYVLNVENDELSKLGKFDFIIMADVIEHLTNPIAALVKAKVLLKPSGSLIFSIPNMANGTVRLELLKGRFEYTDWGLLDKTHLHYYDQEEVRNTLTQAGFKIVSTNCTIRDMPTNLIEKQLNAVGLKATEKFIKHMQSPEVVIFQFIGCAIPSETASKFKATSTTPFDVIDIEVSKIQNDSEQRVTEVNNRLDRVESELAKTRSELEQKTTQLNKILHSRGWKMLEKVYSTKHKLRRT